MGGSTSQRVAVLGGGILGVSTACQLLRAGARVVLVTQGELIDGASARSLSWLNSAGKRSDAYHRLRLAGIDRYRTMAAAHPDANWLRFDGGLRWGDDPDRQRELHEHEVARCYDSRLVSAAEVATVTPGVRPAAIGEGGAIWNAGEGWVDLPSLARLLTMRFLERGGRLVRGAGSCGLITGRDGVIGVRTAEGTAIHADATVLAAGPSVPRLAAEIGLRIPDATPVSLLVTTAPIQVGLRAVLNTPRASVRPTPDGALAVDSDWITPHIAEAGDGGYQVPAEMVAELLAEASQLLADRPSLQAERCAIGPKPIPGDGEPVLGRVDRLPGLHLAFTHSGATLGLIAGELLTYQILSGREHPMLVPFNVRRFSSSAGTAEAPGVDG